MREKLIRFMQGRYGIDQFSKFLLILGVVVVLLSSFLSRNPVGLVFIGLAAPDGTWVRKVNLSMGRQRIRHIAASHGFDLARRYLSGLELK